MKDCNINGKTIASFETRNLPYNQTLKGRANALRHAKNLPEVLFWMRVTKKKFHGFDFDRQRVIGNYIVDFYIKKLSLAIEIDGSSHDFDGDYDERREKYLISLGLKVYRITVLDVLKNMDFALIGLENYIIEHYGRPL
ncbi:MAG: endonuclease domain-containing protein [Flavobacterium sp.]|nr:MAG: endonuclease domain-containing protein [Flavobacterium sp.]